MSNESVGTGTRERVWIEKRDHSTDPPEVVERLFVENGEVKAHEHVPRKRKEAHIADLDFEQSPLNAVWVPGLRAVTIPRRPLGAEPTTFETIALTPRRRKVAIVAASYGREEAPLEDPDWEVWALNLVVPADRFGRVRCDRWFDLHQRVAQTEDDLRWIGEKCPVPIYVPDDLVDAGPRCVRFPIETIEALYPPYWSCTFAYQIALALAEGFDEIGLYGVDLAWGTRRERTVEWANVSWWIAYAEALGVTIKMPEMTKLGTSRYRYGLEYTAEIADVNAYLERTEPGEIAELQRRAVERYDEFVKQDQPVAPPPGRLVGETQSRVGHPGGDCYRACVATILGLPLAEVPDIHYAIEAWTPITRSVSSMAEIAEIERVTLAWDDWLQTRGLARITARAGGGMFRRQSGVLTIGMVVSPSGPWFHAVVCRDGEVVWDPNPNQLAYGRDSVAHDLIIQADPGRSARAALTS